jgi:protein SCO1
MPIPLKPMLRGLALGGIALAFGLLIALAWRDGGERIPVEAGVLWPPGPRVDGFIRTNKGGAALGREGLLGGWHLLFFGYTRCPDICPATLGMMRQLDARLAKQPAERPIDFVFVSVDPARDTPQVLKDYLQWFSPRFIGLTGPQEELARLAASLGVAFIPPGEDADGDGEYVVDHSAVILLLDPQARLVGLYQPPFSPEALESEVRTGIQFLSQHIR